MDLARISRFCCEASSYGVDDAFTEQRRSQDSSPSRLTALIQAARSPPRRSVMTSAKSRTKPPVAAGAGLRSRARLGRFPVRGCASPEAVRTATQARAVARRGSRGRCRRRAGILDERHQLRGDLQAPGSAPHCARCPCTTKRRHAQQQEYSWNERSDVQTDTTVIRRALRFRSHWGGLPALSRSDPASPGEHR